MPCITHFCFITDNDWLIVDIHLNVSEPHTHFAGEQLLITGTLQLVKSILGIILCLDF